MVKPPRIYYVNKLLPPYRAMTIPPFGIFIKKEFKDNKKILNHDLIHWKQYKKMGLFMFYFRYLMQLLIIGYDQMPMEIEARYEEDEFAKLNYSEKYFKKNA